MRQSWHDYFMGLIDKVKDRATCDRLHVGCLLVKDNHILATGYNGSIHRHEHCDDVGHLLYEGGCKRTIHAEMNALLDCAKRGVAVDGATAYVSHYPCPDCMKSLNQAGVKTIFYKHYYAHRYENEFDVGMAVIQYSGDTDGDI